MTLQDNPAPLSRPQAAFIIGGNAVPLLGVMLWGWSVFELMFLYWVENIIVGLLTIPLLFAAGGREGKIAHGIGAAAFFVFHYGLFCMAHGLFVLDLFRPETTGEIYDGGILAPVMFLIHAEPWNGFYWGLAGIVLVQAIQLAQRWALQSHKKVAEVMLLPYPRMLMLHVTIIFGGLLAEALGQPVAALVFLIMLKTAFDLGVIRFIQNKKKVKKNDAGRNLNT